MRKANYVVFDCETGGFNDEENPITQIAMLTLDGTTLKEIDRYETFIKPYNDLKIGKKALEITGLSMTDINNGLRSAFAVAAISKFLKKAKGGNHPSLKPVLVGHNVPFDIGFLSYLFKYKKKDLEDFVSKTHMDTMALTKMFNPKISSLKLGICCEEVGIDLPDAHKAMNDALATADLFRIYVKKLRNSKATVEVESNKQKEKSRVKFQF